MLLFERDRRSVRLTEAGAELLEPARQLIAAAARMAARAQRLAAGTGAASLLDLGYQVRLPEGALTPVVQAHLRAHIDGRVALRQYDFSDTSVGLVSGSSDVSVLSLPVVHDLHTEPLYQDGVVALDSADSALAGKGEVTVADRVATGLPWARPPDDDPVWRDFWTAAPQRAALGPAGLAVRFHSPPNVDSYTSAVAAGTLIGLTNAGFAQAYPVHGIATVPVRDLPPVQFVAARRTDDDRPAVADLFRTLVDTLRGMDPAHRG